jgi:uncharacterized membrane protein
MMQSMSNSLIRSRKITGLFMALYLVVLFGVVAPAHHHEDGAEHSACVVCTIAHQPFVAAASVSVALSVIVVLIKLFISPSFIPFLTPRSFDSRAPPVM